MTTATDRYFRGITMALPQDPYYRTLTDVVVTGPGDTRADLYHGAHNRAQTEFDLRFDRYATTWFDLSPNVLVLPDEPPLPVFWTLTVAWRDHSGERQYSSWGDTLALPHDTRLGLLDLIRQTVEKEHGIPEDHGVLSFSYGPTRLGEAR